MDRVSELRKASQSYSVKFLEFAKIKSKDKNILACIFGSNRWRLRKEGRLSCHQPRSLVNRKVAEKHFVLEFTGHRDRFHEFAYDHCASSCFVYHASNEP